MYMALALRSLHDLPSLTGNVDRRYPLGDAPVIQPATLGINLAAFNASNFVLTNFNSGGTAVDFNYRQFLTGTSAPTATISVSSASGFLGGWVVDASGGGVAGGRAGAGAGGRGGAAGGGGGPPGGGPGQN